MFTISYNAFDLIRQIALSQSEKANSIKQKQS